MIQKLNITSHAFWHALIP